MQISTLPEVVPLGEHLQLVADVVLALGPFQKLLVLLWSVPHQLSDFICYSGFINTHHKVVYAHQVCILMIHLVCHQLM